MLHTSLSGASAEGLVQGLGAPRSVSDPADQASGRPSVLQALAAANIWHSFSRYDKRNFRLVCREARDISQDLVTCVHVALHGSSGSGSDDDECSERTYAALGKFHSQLRCLKELHVWQDCVAPVVLLRSSIVFPHTTEGSASLYDPVRAEQHLATYLEFAPTAFQRTRCICVHANIKGGLCDRFLSGVVPTITGACLQMRDFRLYYNMEQTLEGCSLEFLRTHPQLESIHLLNPLPSCIPNEAACSAFLDTLSAVPHVKKLSLCNVGLYPWLLAAVSVALPQLESLEVGTYQLPPTSAALSAALLSMPPLTNLQQLALNNMSNVGHVAGDDGVVQRLQAPALPVEAIEQLTQSAAPRLSSLHGTRVLVTKYTPAECSAAFVRRFGGSSQHWALQCNDAPLWDYDVAWSAHVSRLVVSDQSFDHERLLLAIPAKFPHLTALSLHLAVRVRMTADDDVRVPRAVAVHLNAALRRLKCLEHVTLDCINNGDYVRDEDVLGDNMALLCKGLPPGLQVYVPGVKYHSF